MRAWQNISVRADITVKSNASERWDTTFYLPLNDKSPQVIPGGWSAKSCSILLPKPNEEGRQIWMEISVATSKNRS